MKRHLLPALCASLLLISACKGSGIDAAPEAPKAEEGGTPTATPEGDPNTAKDQAATDQNNQENGDNTPDDPCKPPPKLNPKLKLPKGVNLPPAATALTGQPDNDFGAKGVVTSKEALQNIGGLGLVLGWGASLINTAVDADGRIYVSTITMPNAQDADIIVLRFLPNGTLDQTFGELGRTTFFNPNDVDLQGTMGLQKDGKILIGGFMMKAKKSVLIRLNTDGKIDTSFGPNPNQNGIMMGEFGKGGGFYKSIIPLDNGSFVAAGDGTYKNNFKECLVQQMTDGGIPSGSFGDAKGTVALNYDGGESTLRGATLLSDGRIALVCAKGGAQPFKDSGFHLFILDSTGKTVADYKEDTLMPSAVMATHQNHLITAGNSAGTYVQVLSGFAENSGALAYDKDFGSIPDSGMSSFFALPPNKAVLNMTTDMTPLNEATFLATGFAMDSVNKHTIGYLAQFSNDGELVPGFAKTKGGVLLFNEKDIDETPTSIALSPLGKIIVAGMQFNTATKESNLVLRSFLK